MTVSEPPVAALPAPSRISPEKVVLFAPTRKFLLPRVTIPPPSMEPTVVPPTLSPLLARVALPGLVQKQLHALRVDAGAGSVSPVPQPGHPRLQSEIRIAK